MLPQKYRIPRKLFKPLLEEKRFYNTAYLSLRMAPGDGPRVAVSVSKKVSKSAVKRNTARRRIYSALRPFFPTFPKTYLLVIARPGAEKLKGENLNAELENLLKKAKIY